MTKIPYMYYHIHPYGNCCMDSGWKKTKVLSLSMSHNPYVGNCLYFKLYIQTNPSLQKNPLFFSKTPLISPERYTEVGVQKLAPVQKEVMEPQGDTTLCNLKFFFVIRNFILCQIKLRLKNKTTRLLNYFCSQ